MTKVLVYVAALAGTLSSVLWYEPGKLEMKAAMLGTLLCAVVAGLAMMALIAFVRSSGRPRG